MNRCWVTIDHDNNVGLDNVVQATMLSLSFNRISYFISVYLYHPSKESGPVQLMNA